jgi:hypothetical protein
MKRYNEYLNIAKLHELGYDDMQKYLRDRMEKEGKKCIMEELNVSLPTVHKWLTFYDISRV